MELAAIAPTAWAPHLCKDRPYNLLFTELVVQSEEYASFWAKKSGVRIMDCMIHERRPTPSDATLMQAVALVGPSVVVVPDVLYSASQTKDAFKRIVRQLPSFIQPMAVPQGQNREELLACASWMLERTDLIGLHQGIPRLWHIERGSLLPALKELNSHVKVHMLGLPPRGLALVQRGSGSHVGLLDFDPSDPCITGVDSAKPVYQGVFPGAQARPQEFLAWTLEDYLEWHEPVLRSIRVWQSLVSATTTV